MYFLLYYTIRERSLSAVPVECITHTPMSLHFSSFTADLNTTWKLEYRGDRQMFDCRVWFLAKTGEMRPTKRGFHAPPVTLERVSFIPYHFFLKRRTFEVILI